jgi:hypothetical protein
VRVLSPVPVYCHRSPVVEVVTMMPSTMASSCWGVRLARSVVTMAAGAVLVSGKMVMAWF